MMMSKKKKPLKWQDIWSLPLNYDDISYVWSANNTMTLMFEYDIDNEVIHKIVNALNGAGTFKIKNLTVDRSDFFENDEYIFCIRGWGSLHSPNGFNLSCDHAAQLQDEFAQYILKHLHDKHLFTVLINLSCIHKL